MTGIGICVRCRQPFEGASAESCLCPDCMQEGVHLMRVATRRPRGVACRLGELGAFILLFIGCLACLVCFIGWLWQGIQTLRLIFGG